MFDPDDLSSGFFFLAMLQRAVSGIIFVAILTFCIVWHPLALAAFFGLATVVGIYEFYNIVSKKKENSPFWILGILSGALLYILAVGVFLEWWQASAMLALIPLTVLVFLFALYSKRQLPTNRVAFTILGWIYISLPFASTIGVGHRWGEYEWPVVLGFFIMLWLNDTGAYLSGRAFGKTKLFPRHSPNKTWEGFVGGVVLCCISGFVLSRIFDQLQLHDWLVMAAIISIFSNLGDLAESMLKRQFGVKDSGKIMPGHGGVLDRFDGVLFSMPLILTYFTFMYGN